MGKREDLTGMRFGNLTVIDYAYSKRYKSGQVKAIWNCKCDCGNIAQISAHYLKSGKKKNCGCIKKPKKKPLDLTGKRFGRLTALEISGKKNGKYYWKCKCDCGNEKNVSTMSLRSGHTISCGCYRSETFGNITRKHGFSKTRLETCYRNMMRRCYDPKAPEYMNYGGRGIQVCKEWHELKVFAEWAIENGWDENKNKFEQSIDRIDVNGDYCPENCRFADVLTQANNKINSTKLEYNGEIHTYPEWERITGVKARTISYRVSRGWPAEKVLEVDKNNEENKDQKNQT